MSKSGDLRKQAEEAGKRGDESKSLRKGAEERRREKALNDMADNEDWLDGMPPNPPKRKKYHTRWPRAVRRHLGRGWSVLR